MDSEEHLAPSLDQLSQAFAEAMDRQRQNATPPNNDSTIADVDQSTPDSGEERRAVDADDVCPISPETVLEAILFVGHPTNEPIRTATIANLIRGVEEDEVPDLVSALNETYSEMELPFLIEGSGAGYRMALHGGFHHVRERFYGRIRQVRLTQSAVDVLAIVAYNQPMTREEVDKVLNTGQNSSRILNQLVRRDLLARRLASDDKSRKEFVTTERFLAFFNLRDISDLPRSEDPQ